MYQIFISYQLPRTQQFLWSVYSAHAQELYQYLVWDVDAEEDVTDHVTNDFFEAIDKDQGGSAGKSDKKKKKSSKKKKKKSTSSDSSEESDDSSSTSDPWIKIMFPYVGGNGPIPSNSPSYTT